MEILMERRTPAVFDANDYLMEPNKPRRLSFPKVFWFEINSGNERVILHSPHKEEPHNC